MFWRNPTAGYQGFCTPDIMNCHSLVLSLHKKKTTFSWHRNNFCERTGSPVRGLLNVKFPDLLQTLLSGREASVIRLVGHTFKLGFTLFGSAWRPKVKHKKTAYRMSKFASETSLHTNSVRLIMYISVPLIDLALSAVLSITDVKSTWEWITSGMGIQRHGWLICRQVPCSSPQHRDTYTQYTMNYHDVKRTVPGTEKISQPSLRSRRYPAWFARKNKRDENIDGKVPARLFKSIFLITRKFRPSSPSLISLTSRRQLLPPSRARYHVWRRKVGLYGLCRAPLGEVRCKAGRKCNNWKFVVIARKPTHKKIFSDPENSYWNKETKTTSSWAKKNILILKKRNVFDSKTKFPAGSKVLLIWEAVTPWRIFLLDLRITFC